MSYRNNIMDLLLTLISVSLSHATFYHLDMTNLFILIQNAVRTANLLHCWLVLM